MISYLRKLFTNKASSQNHTKSSSPTKKVSSNIENKSQFSNKNLLNEIDINSIDYYPLPPSPNVWDLDGRDEFNQIYQNKIYAPLFNSLWKSEFSKVVKLSKNIKIESTPEEVKTIIVKAYRKIILSRQKSQKYKSAIEWSLEMFERFDDFTTDSDKRKVNILIRKLEKSDKKHKFKLFEVQNLASLPKFVLKFGTNVSLSNSKKNNKNQKSEYKYSIKQIQTESIVYF